MPAELNPCSSVSIIIVTYNSAQVLPGLMDSLSEGLRGIDDFEIVIVDNASSDQSVNLALAHPMHPRVIEMGRNAGYAAGINAAQATIRPERSILILNPDIRLKSRTAHTLLDALSQQTVGVAVPQILNEDGTIALSLRREPSVVTAWADALLGRYAAKFGISEIIGDPAYYSMAQPVEWATGAALLVAPWTRHSVGNWDESFFLYSEEVDYLRRVRGQGLTVAYVPDAKMVHIGGEYRDNPWLSALLASNRIRYFQRHHSAAATAAFRLAILAGAVLRFALAPSHRAVFKAALIPVRPPV